MIIEQILVTGMAVFCYLLVDKESKEALLIDPAGDYHKIDSVINKHNADIKMVVNTHGHFDHTSGNDYYIKKTGADLLIHKADSGKLNSMINKLLSRANGGKGSPSAVRYLQGGDIIKLGKSEIKVIHTPGHTPGGICLLYKDNIFTGDTLFTEGMGRTDLPGGSYNKIIHSIQKRILSLPDNTIIWPGHNYGRNPKTTVKEQKRYYK